jgi:chemotaxis protein methyltransferase WspC
MNARELLQRETGLVLTDAVAERALAERLARLGQLDADAYLATIGADEMKALIELVVVPESWMFRDADAFATLARFVRELVAQAPERLVRILSIPCAGGEEPYSIAMALRDAGVPRSATLIEAIDLSEAALARARLGRYTRNAFRGADLAFRDRHFTRDGAEYQINQALREQVMFSRANLLTLDSGANAGRYDVVFCRNLLIYFDEPTAASAIDKLRLMLAERGLLFAGYAEVPVFCNHGFAPLREPGAFALQKARRPVTPAAPAAPRASRAPSPSPSPSPSPAPARAARTLAPGPPVAVAPPDPAQLLEQAARLAGQGDYPGAASACHAVLFAHADAAEAYYILGMVSECEGKRAVAGDYWRRCVYLQPDHYEALCHLALLAKESGDAAQAAALKQRAARVYERRDERASRKASP